MAGCICFCGGKLAWSCMQIEEAACNRGSRLIVYSHNCKRQRWHCPDPEACITLT